MASSMQVTGIASGLDTSSLISKIMEYAKKNKQAIEAEKAVAETELKVWQGVNSGVLALNTVCATVADAADFKSFSVTSSNEDILTASASTSAVAGSHYLTVVQRAQVHQVASTNAYNSTSDSIGTGTVSINFTGSPTDSFTVDIDSNNNTLAGLRDTINRAGKNVQATIINSGTSDNPQYQLLLTSKNSGDKGIFTVSSSLEGGTAPNLSKIIQQGQNATVKLGTGENAITVT